MTRWAAALALLLAASPARAAERVALLVANSVGSADERDLRFPEQDARRLAAVLTELGDFAPTDVHLLVDRSSAEVLAELDRLARGSASSLFLFYFSGHADGAALHLGGTKLEVETLLRGLETVPTRLRIGVLDACQSGGITRAKGVRPGPDFEVRIDGSSEGRILISSSASDEQSFESDALGGAVFSLHLTAGLRGAADEDGDGTVTTSEAYRYAYAQTLRGTWLSAGGPQHPSFRMDLAGRREPVLTRIGVSAKLTLGAEEGGEYVVFDADERRVLVELPLSAGERRRIALAPGSYVVRKRGPRGVQLAKVSLGPGDDRLLPESRMRSLPTVRLARKGALGDSSAVVTLGQYWSALGPEGLGRLGVGFESERGLWLFGARAVGSWGGSEHAGLQTRYRSLGLQGSALLGLRLRSLVARAGPTAGIFYLDQMPFNRPLRRAPGAALGAQARLEVELTRNVCLLAGGELTALLAPTEPRMPYPGLYFGGWGLMRQHAYELGMRVGW